MLKRSIILLALAGGLVLGITQPQALHARAATAQAIDLPDYLIDQILSETASQLGMTLVQAHDAYDNGSLTITEVNITAEGTEFLVSDLAGGVDILDLIEGL